MGDAVPVLFLLLAILFVSLVFFLPLPLRSRRSRADRNAAGRRPAQPRAGRSGSAGDRAELPADVPTADMIEAPGPPVAQEPDRPPLRLAQLRYDQGDWSAVPDALRQLGDFFNTACEPRAVQLHFGLRGRELGPVRPDFVFATGHHGFALSAADRQGLLEYLGAGGVVLIEDNNGLDNALRRFLDDSWPHHKLEPVTGGDLFAGPFALSGYPKIRRHQGLPARLFRIRLDERELDFFYSFSCDLGDGWQNHPYLRVPPDKRRMALEMGANFLAYALGKKAAGR